MALLTPFMGLAEVTGLNGPNKIWRGLKAHFQFQQKVRLHNNIKKQREHEVALVKKQLLKALNNIVCQREETILEINRYIKNLNRYSKLHFHHIEDERNSIAELRKIITKYEIRLKEKMQIDKNSLNFSNDSNVQIAKVTGGAISAGILTSASTYAYGGMLGSVFGVTSAIFSSPLILGGLALSPAFFFAGKAINNITRRRSQCIDYEILERKTELDALGTIQNEFKLATTLINRNMFFMKYLTNCMKKINDRLENIEFNYGTNMKFNGLHISQKQQLHLGFVIMQVLLKVLKINVVEHGNNIGKNEICLQSKGEG